MELETCTRVVLQEQAVRQPLFVAGTMLVCCTCAQSCFPPGVVEGQSGQSEAAVCQCREQGHECLFAAAPPAPELASFVAGELLGAFQRSVGQRRVAGAIAAHLEIASHLDSGEAQEEALALLPPELLALACPDVGERDDAQLLTRLLAWWKEGFFAWVGQEGLPCAHCGSARTRTVGGAAPVPEEWLWGAAMVELFECSDCRRHTRFPRFNNARKLLQTRRGRCGEYAQTFCLFLAALGYETRLVVDLTDHVWSELRLGGRWVHADTGELTVDKPLLYESGWGKRLTYCFAVRAREAVDVTRRYTRHWAEVAARRDLCSEEWLEGHLAELRARLERGLAPEEAARLHAEQEAELRELREMEGSERAPRSQEQQGRITGDAAWHEARGENTGN